MLHCRVNSEKLHPNPDMKSLLPYILFGLTFIALQTLGKSLKLRA